MGRGRACSSRRRLRNEGSSIAERGRALARGGNVHSVQLNSRRSSSHRVVGSDGRECVVTFTADPIPPRVWAAVALSARRNERLAAAMEGREQSVHLEHLMRFDWDEPLIPSNDVRREVHVRRSARVRARRRARLRGRRPDRRRPVSPAPLARMRRCRSPVRTAAGTRASAPPIDQSGIGPWQAGRSPPACPPRPLPSGASSPTCLGPERPSGRRW